METKGYGIALGWPLAPGQAIPLLVIAGTAVTTATQDVAYTGFTVSATGGTTPYVFALRAGSLPAGITLNATTGVVSGTPTTAAAYAGIGIRVTDARGRTADLGSFTITVALPVAIAGTPVTTATKDSPYTGFSASASHGTTPYVYSLHAGTLPTGITLNASTGAVAGTPTVVQTKTGIVIRATDAYGSFADLAAFQIVVSA